MFRRKAGIKATNEPLPWRVFFPLEPSPDEERDVRSFDRVGLITLGPRRQTRRGRQGLFRALLLARQILLIGRF